MIDKIVRDLHVLRGQLITELRTDEDARAPRVDSTLAEGTATLADSPGFRQLIAHLDEGDTSEAGQ